LDDFGTGYSSLSYLRRMPVDIIKLDRTFVSDLLGDAQESRVTRALIELAHNIGTVVLAEGVEESAQVAALMEQGCHLAQGYLMARPVDPQDFRALLDRRLLPPEDPRGQPAALAEISSGTVS
jgi:EAL domain-containing protein (putative c-di-GMP-specific phosphodiesterase class I)